MRRAIVYALGGVVLVAGAGCVASQGRGEITTCEAALTARLGAECDFVGTCSDPALLCGPWRSCSEGLVTEQARSCPPPPDGGPDAPPPPDAGPDAPPPDAPPPDAPPPPDAGPDAPPPPDAMPDAPPPPPPDAGPDAPPPPRDAGRDASPRPVWVSCEDFIALGGRAGDRCDPDVFMPCGFANGCCDRRISCTATGRAIYSDSCIPDCTIPMCDGYAPPPPAFTPCTSAWDCDRGESCLPPGARSCGDICEMSECTTDADCPPEAVCEVDPTGCGCGFEVERCRLSCATSGCMADEVCGDDGHCRALSCESGWTCPASSACRVGHDAADRHGCVRRSCFSDADCDCGSCIDGLCWDGPGACMFLGG